MRQMVTTKEAATLMGVSTAFLERDRSVGRTSGSGPLIPFVRVGNRAVRYRIEDLEAHIADRMTIGASDE